LKIHTWWGYSYTVELDPRRQTSPASAGPYEQALVGTPVANPSRPLELLRTVHSFDPCLACAVHVLDAERSGQRTTVSVEAGA